MLERNDIGHFNYWSVSRGFFLAAVIALGYFVPNFFVLFPTHSVVITSVDHWITLQPAWIWFYISYYPLLIGTWFVTNGTEAKRAYFDAMFLSAVVGFLVFLFFPTSISRDLYPWSGPMTWSAVMLSWIRGADAPVNCLPSMHVCMSFIACSFMTLVLGARGRMFIWTLFAAICYSTLATKQHYFVDLFAGFALGLTCVGIALKRHDLLPHVSEFLPEKLAYKLSRRD